MNKILATLILAGTMQNIPIGVQAQIDINRDKTNKQTTEILASNNFNEGRNQENTYELRTLNDTKISEEMLNLLKDPEILKDLMKHEKFQKFLKDNNLEEGDIEKIVEGVISNEESMKIIKNILETKDITEIVNELETETVEDEEQKGNYGLTIVLTLLMIVCIGGTICTYKAYKEAKDTAKSFRY